MISKSVCRDKKLIISADDFGLHDSINAAVEAGHTEGVLTSASIVACGDAFDDAVVRSRRNPRLGIGVHLTFVEETPISPCGRIPSLVGSDGMFHKGHAELFRRFLARKVDPDDIAAEAEAQIARVFDAGLAPTHIDSHQHIHILPVVLNALRPVLKKFSIKRVRSLSVPFSDYRWLSIKKSIFAVFARYASRLKRAGYDGPDHFYGFFNSGELDKDYIKGVIGDLRPGVTEIAFHPGVDNVAIRQRYGAWGTRYGWKCDWVNEYRLLVDPDIRSALVSSGASLINYSGI